MPEIPDLEVVKDTINREIGGRRLLALEILQPLVFRCSLEECRSRLDKAQLVGVKRRGKFLLLEFSTGNCLIVHCMLTGRFHLATTGDRLFPRTVFRMVYEGDRELRYFDSNLMGKIYLTRNEEYKDIPQFADLGPEPLDPSFTEEIFLLRLARHRGMIKNVLKNQRFVAGIGNAYSDEILFRAGISPLRKCSTLNDDERSCLYESMVATLKDAIEHIKAQTRIDIHKEKRDFLSVHSRGGKPCPKCGTPVSEITPNKQITSFCRVCQH